MKKIFFILLLSFSVNAQVVISHSFSNFTGQSVDSTLSEWIFDRVYRQTLSVSDTSLLSDIGSNNATLSIEGWASYAVMLDSLKSGSPIYSGGNALKLDGSNDDLYTSSGTLFNPDSVLTVIAWVYASVNGASQAIVTHKGDALATDAGWKLTKHSSNVYRAEINPGTVNTYVPSAANTTLSAWLHVAMVIDLVANEGKFYINGIQSGSTADLSSLGPITANPAVALIIGRSSFGSGVQQFSGRIAKVRYAHRAYTQQELREDGFLASGWVSRNGNVTRENLAFAQTFWDTIGVPLPDATLGNNQVWQLAYKGKSADATKTINAWIGSAAVAKSSVYTITVGTSFAINTVNFGDAFALSSDTLWFASASTADTVSVDDVVLAATFLNTKFKFNQSNGYNKN
jgi:hypothetical protein